MKVEERLSVNVWSCVLKMGKGKGGGGGGLKPFIYS